MRITSLSVIAIALAASGCAATGQQAERAPQPNLFDYGVFAYDDGRLMRLATESIYSAQEPASWDARNNLDGDVRLVVNDSDLPESTQIERVGLWRMSEVENVAYDTPQRAGGVPPWIRNEAEPVPITFGTYPTNNMFEVIPRKPLEPGLYALFYDGDERTTLARFGVNWQQAEAVAFDSNACVDRVSQGNVSYRPCPPGTPVVASTQAGSSTAGTASAAALAPAGFALVLDEPVHRIIGNDNVLDVSGEIANTTGTPAQIPPIRFTLKDSSGSVLRSWDMPAPQAQLQPGATAKFSHSLHGLPQGAATVTAAIDQPQ